MNFKVIQGSGTGAKPPSFKEQERRLRELRVINWSPKESYPLAWSKVDPDKQVGSYIFQFKFGLMEIGALVTIRVVFDDEQSGSQMVITNMTTLPDGARGEGYGTQALQAFLKAFGQKGFTDIQAVQVQKPSERFWVKNGFIALGNTTNDFKYTKRTDPA